ncbi:MAG: hypothetical protein DWQ10_15075 [Calditrichaeota bacterium]|nr:MAG: hypothetical protein DWQ10_15075 [Calditrichota bacterium]
MGKRDSKSSLLSHSEAKVRLLGEYIKRYLNIISNDQYTTKINIHDLFCGGGLYENGGEGSPLVILNEIKNVHFKNVARLNSIIPIDCYFNDIDKQKIYSLQKVIQNRSLFYDEFGAINFSSNDYQDELKELIPLLSGHKKEKFFIFIDPYGYKEFRIKQIKDLISSGNSEVLLWLPIQFMSRFAAKGTPTALTNIIEDLSENNKRIESSISAWEFIKWLKIGFTKYLGTNNFFVDTFTIQKDKNTVFCLFFFSSHIKGFEKMLEAKWNIDTEQGKGWNFRRNQLDLFQQIVKNPFEQNLKEYLKKKRRYNGDLFEFTLRKSFLPKHTNEILSNWQKEGILEVFQSEDQKARIGSFYLSYQYFRDEYKKVYYKLRQ